ncbi:AAA domain-containing protein [Mycoplasma todarodis]|nr:AAA domain-containing protein [Mycoplasma todarodis]
MEKYNENEHALVDIDRVLENKPEYKKMLNNLLGIGTRDNATFTSSRTNNFDLESLLTESDYKKVFEGKTFTVEIKSIKDNLTIQALEKTTNSEEFIEVADSQGELISIANRKLLEKNFETNKEKLILKIKKAKNKKVAKWKLFRNKYLDKQVQENSWPLYVGSMFVKVRTYSSKNYAPLLLKKVSIEITPTNKIQIKAMDDFVYINQKLLFLLQNEYKFSLPKLDEETKYSLKEASDIYKESLKDIIEETIEFPGKFEFCAKGDVVNQDLQYAPGILLSILSPAGGGLRDKLLQLIADDQLDEILDIDELKDFKSEVMQKLEEGESIFRINQTDFSQEKAIVGSLKENSIIWGPPGTGKSQVISNIVANILAKDESALITSEKKAALDVIQSRMGKLSKFMFFGLTDKNTNKELFYKPFKEFATITRQATYVDEKDSSTLMNNESWKMLKLKNHLKDEDITSISKVWNELSIEQKEPELLIKNQDLIHNNKDILIALEQGKDIEENLNQMKIKKKGLLFKRYSKNVRGIIKLYKQYNYNANILNAIANVQNIEILNNIDEYKIIEKGYQNSRSNFKSDEDYLEALLAYKFREKMLILEKESPEKKKAVKSFLRACDSAWSRPYRFVNKHKNIIHEIYNVFVSTPQTLASIIDMDRRYHYAIFDEASQMHVEKGIPYISMADISIIAGDNQQMRPTSWMVTRDNSIQEEETEVDAESILDLAYRKGLTSREYMLTKNYRSKSSDLMMFSSKEFYKGELDVIDNKDFINEESIEVYDVNGKWETRANELEAKSALNYLLEVQDEYKSIILLTLNSSQKQFVESMIYNVPEYSEIPELLKEGKVYLRNLENIQGDEADLVIVSVAYDKHARLGSTYVARPEGKNALNVAISRAVEKMVVFKSIKPEEVNLSGNNDSMRIFKEWLVYLELQKSNRRTYLLDSNKESEQFDSEFEEDVYDYLINNLEIPKSCFIETQFSIGSYKVDIVIKDSETGEFKLGIEVDGYRYHSGFEKMTKDIERQRFIEAKGYPIYRITELNWKTSKDIEVENIKTIIVNIH